MDILNCFTFVDLDSLMSDSPLTCRIHPGIQYKDILLESLKYTCWYPRNITDFEDIAAIFDNFEKIDVKKVNILHEDLPDIASMDLQHYLHALYKASIVDRNIEIDIIMNFGAQEKIYSLLSNCDVSPAEVNRAFLFKGNEYFHSDTYLAAMCPWISTTHDLLMSCAYALSSNVMYIRDYRALSYVFKGLEYFIEDNIIIIHKDISKIENKDINVYIGILFYGIFSSMRYGEKMLHIVFDIKDKLIIENSVRLFGNRLRLSTYHLTNDDLHNYMNADKNHIIHLIKKELNVDRLDMETCSDAGDAPPVALPPLQIRNTSSANRIMDVLNCFTFVDVDALLRDSQLTCRIHPRKPSKNILLESLKYNCWYSGSVVDFESIAAIFDNFEKLSIKKVNILHEDLPNMPSMDLQHYLHALYKALTVDRNRDIHVVMNLSDQEKIYSMLSNCDVSPSEVNKVFIFKGNEYFHSDTYLAMMCPWISTFHDLYKSCAYALSSYFIDSNNWDALYEVVGSLESISEGNVIIIHKDISRINIEDLYMYIDILLDSIYLSIEYRDQILYIVFDNKDRPIIEKAVRLLGDQLLPRHGITNDDVYTYMNTDKNTIVNWIKRELSFGR